MANTAEPRTGPVICVFCGASSGSSPAYLEAARALAHSFHDANATLVYGGGTVGIMGEVARTLVSLSGPSAVQGVIPKILMEREKKFVSDTLDPKTLEKKNWTTDVKDREQSQSNQNGTSTPDSIEVLGHLFENEYGKTTIVPDMHTRKRLMAKKVIDGPPGSGFVALPGGYGTMDELMEIVTWNQLGIHERGIVILNVEGYWGGLLQWIEKAVDSGFVAQGNARIMVECKDAGEVVEKLKNYQVAEGRLSLNWGEE